MPETTTSPRSFVRPLIATAAALFIAAAGLLVASPASAHDELESSDPAADSSLEALPSQLTLTFSGILSTEAGATELQVTDAAGATLAEGAPVVQENVVTQALTGAASGAVTVLWKVVSSDGHPISGQYTFTVTAPPSPTATPSVTPSATPSESATPADSATPEPVVTAAPVSDEGSATPWIIGALILLAAVGGAVLYLLVSRARRQKALAQTPGHGPAAPSDGTSSSDSQPNTER